MTPTSHELYTMLQAIFCAAEEAIRKSGYDHPVGFTIYGGTYWQRNGNLDIRIGSSPSENVSGKDFWSCVDEFLRREGFNRSQANLQLGAPQIDPEEDAQ